MKRLSLRLEFPNADEFVLGTTDRIDPNRLREDLLASGIKYLSLTIAQDLTVDLFVEDDASFLADAYNELLDCALSKKKRCFHTVFLGDGALEIESEIKETKVVVHIVYTPHLDKRFSQKRELKTCFGSYLAGWHELMGKLVLAAG